jgi:hypothetical protein
VNLSARLAMSIHLQKIGWPGKIADCLDGTREFEVVADRKSATALQLIPKRSNAM